MASAAQSYAAQFGLGTIGGNSTATSRYDIRETDLGLQENFIDANGLRGTTARVVERNLAGNRPCSGSVSMQPTAVELSNMLQWIMGGSTSGSPTVTYPFADTRPQRSVVIDRVTNVYSYNTAAVSSWSVSGMEDQALNWKLNLIALDEYVAAAGSFPSLTLDTTTFPFKFTDCVVNCAGTVYTPKNFTLNVDYKIDTGRFFNSQTLTGIFSQDRVVTFQASFPDAEAHALYGVGRGGFSVLITATALNAVLTFSMAAVAVPRNTPPVPERREIMLPIRGQAFQSGSTLELVTTLDAST